jgi:hypothetical protein
MIRAVANKRLSLSDSEYAYLESMISSVGDSDLRGLFDTDKNGIITAITPPLDRPINMAAFYFVLNVMVNQRLRMIDQGAENNSKIIAIEGAVATMDERLKRLEQKQGAISDKSV